MSDFSKTFKEFSSLKLDPFRPTTTHVIIRAREFKKYFAKIVAILDTLGITDEESRVKLITIHDFDLVKQAKAAVTDTQVSSTSGVFKKLQKKLEIYLQCNKLEEQARRRLTNLKQKPNQSAADILVEITELYEEAGWSDSSKKDEQIRSYLMEALRHDEVRLQYNYSEMQGKVALTIAQIIDVANVVEANAVSNQLSREKTWSSSEVVKAIKQYHQRPKANSGQNSSSQKASRPCLGCGSKDHKYRSPSCAAAKAKCRHCGNLGHFQSQCLQKNRPAAGNHTSNKKQFRKKKKQRYFRANKVGESETNNPDTEPRAGPSRDLNTDPESIVELMENNLTF